MALGASPDLWHPVIVPGRLQREPPMGESGAGGNVSGLSFLDPTFDRVYNPRTLARDASWEPRLGSHSWPPTPAVAGETPDNPNKHEAAPISHHLNKNPLRAGPLGGSSPFLYPTGTGCSWSDS